MYQNIKKIADQDQVGFIWEIKDASAYKINHCYTTD